MIAGAALAGWRFPLRAWRAAWPWLGLQIVVAAALTVTPIRVAGWGWDGALLLASLLAWSRLANLAIDKPPPRGLRAETAAAARLAGALILTAIFLFLLALLGFVILLCFAYAAASAGHGFVASDVTTWPGAVEVRGRILVSGIGLAIGAALLWTALRVSLAVFATADEGVVRMIATWPITRGRTLTILAAVILVALPPLAVVLGLRLLAPSLGAQGVAFAQALVVLGYWAPAKLGVLGRLYLDLRPDAPQTPRR
ncbi:MAG: hypothetical protein KGL69_04810 [Alphaproteobacteria bacterium]|nr:hypothetical protein [Alphaproteobacteria bacterium]